MRSKTLVIAEAGINHNGDLSLAKKLIRVAAHSRADYVKFQTFKTEDLVTRTASKSHYQKLNETDTESQFELLKKYELNKAMHIELISEAKNLGINFMSTAFDIENLNMLISLGQKFIKVPSGEITNLPYLRKIGEFRKEVMLSTGMSTIDEVGAAVRILVNSGTDQSKITVLHCTSSYPTSYSDVNLLAMLEMKNRFGVNVGYSDHTMGTEVAVAAVALGATVIEKHFTLDKNLPGPDHSTSLLPDELKMMVNQIRNIENSMGDGLKRPMICESENLKLVRRSIVAKRKIKKGDILNSSNITTKRPGTGISPMNWDHLIGSAAIRDYEEDELIDKA